MSGLLSDKDKEVRALGLEQVRDEVKGAEATRRFAALLPRLSPEARAALLGALGERGDAAARPAVLDQIECAEPEVRSAAIRAVGPGRPRRRTGAHSISRREEDREGRCRRYHEAPRRGSQSCTLGRGGAPAAGRSCQGAQPSGRPARR